MARKKKRAAGGGFGGGPERAQLLSYNVMGELDMGGRNFNDIMDYFSNQILLPVGGMLDCGIRRLGLKKEASRDELTTLNAFGYEVWHFLISASRYRRPC